MATMAPGIEIAFVEVPAPQSAHLVRRLHAQPTVAMAAAVYSGVDVVAVFDGSQPEIDDAFESIRAGGKIITHVDRFRVDRVEDGPV